LISGGDALVEVVLPTDVTASDVRVSVDGQDDISRGGCPGNSEAAGQRPRSQHYVESLTPAGARRFSVLDDNILPAPVASPVDSLLLLGGQRTYGQPGVVRAYDLRGAPQWEYQFPNEGTFCLVPTAPARFRRDGAAAYVGVQRLCEYDPPWDSYLYAFRTGSGTGTTPPPPPPAPTADTVTVTRADYATKQRQLRIDAKSTSSSATLRVYVAATDQLIGTLSSGGNGSYSGRFSWPVNPQRITVKSSLGGSSTATVADR